MVKPVSEQTNQAGPVSSLIRHQNEYWARVDDAVIKDAERYRWLRDNLFNSLHLSRNDNTSSNYVTAKEWIERLGSDLHEDDDPAEQQKMKDTNTIWTLQWYPITPIGFNAINGASLDFVVDAAMSTNSDTP